MEPVEAVGEVVEQRALGLDQVRRTPCQALGVVAGVGVRALGEEDLDLGARAACAPLAAANAAAATSSALKPAWAARRSISDTIPASASAPRRWAVRSATTCAGAVATRDVAGVGQAPVDRADRVRVDSQGGAQLADGREPRSGLQPAGVDLVGELPVDLGRDRDVGVPLDIEVAVGAGAVRSVVSEWPKVPVDIVR